MIFSDKDLDQSWKTCILRYKELHKAMEFEEALHPAQEALDIAQAHLGKDHPLSIESLNNIALLYFEQNRLAEALESYVEARQRAQAALYPEHPLLAQIYCGIADIYLQQGLYQEAISFYQNAIEIFEIDESRTMPGLVPILTKLAQAFERHANIEDARMAYETLYDLHAAHYEYNQEHEINLIGKVALLYAYEGKEGEAIPRLEKAIALIPSGANPNYPLYFDCINALGEIYLNYADYESAEKLFQNLLKTQEKVYSPHHPEIVNTLHQLIASYEGLERIDKAENHYKSALTLLETLYGTDSEYVAEEISALGAFYFYNNDLNKAVSCLNRVLAIEKTIFGEDNYQVAETLHKLGTICLAEGAYETAKNYFEEALGLRRTANKEIEVSISLFTLGTLHKIQGEYPLAEDYLQQALKIQTKLLGEEALPTQETQQSLLEVVDLKSFQENVKKNTDICINENIDLPQIDPQQLKQTSNQLAQVANIFSSAIMHCQNQEYRKAIDLFIETLAILEAEHGSEHPDILPVVEQLAQAYAALGHDEQAQQCRTRASYLRK